MNRLIDAFLELPAWQGIALVALAVVIVASLCFITSLVTRLPRRSPAKAGHLHAAPKLRGGGSLPR